MPTTSTSAQCAHDVLELIEERTSYLHSKDQVAKTLPRAAEELVKQLAAGADTTPAALRALKLAEKHAHKLGWQVFLALRQRRTDQTRLSEHTDVTGSRSDAAGLPIAQQEHQAYTSSRSARRRGLALDAIEHLTN